MLQALTNPLMSGVGTAAVPVVTGALGIGSPGAGDVTQADVAAAKLQYANPQAKRLSTGVRILIVAAVAVVTYAILSAKSRKPMIVRSRR